MHRGTGTYAAAPTGVRCRNGAANREKAIMAEPKSSAGAVVSLTRSFLFLGSEDSSYMGGQAPHPDRGEIVNG